jgi:hypothetical protein
MKTLILGLVTLLSVTSHAGGGGGFGSGPIDTTVLSCFQLSPVQEGVATAGLHIADNGLRMGFSNHVNDFNVSFEPIKVITQLTASALMSEQGGLLVAESANQDFKITISAVEVLASTGSVIGQIEVRGQLMQGSCSVNLNNLKLALK